MKKLLTAAALLTAACILTGCNKKDGKIRIGVIQLVEHPALDKSYQGFVDGLAEAGYKDGENIVIDYQNAQAEQANCVTIANKFINDRDDLIFAIATPAAQAVANLTKKIPILVTAVTDPETAKLVKSNKKPETNVTGTSDLTPVAAQISLLKKLVPTAETVGLLYCSSEANSIFQINIAKEACLANGLAFLEGSVSNSNEIQQVTQSLVGKVDAFYIPTDNMLAAGLANVAMVANNAKLPTICGEDGMVVSGGLATYGINYYELGKLTAKQAVKIIEKEATPATMPIEYLEKFDFTYNKDTAAAIGIEIPDNL
ncbi:ABC transporter substrate-binding protein [uncultured Treponema sp.]|uniref:ABC transporter substrate-binding protein n=1 Tax=uncultured Treponema sp. TaxID=162155 RepID=UPI0025FDE5F1|nr:ABC transporter substrate-binding protein [uncultured Treponema sp.]